MKYLKEPYKEEEIINILHPFVKEWFFNTYKSFSKTQLYGVMEVHLKNNILISAATGGTKTLTAFLSVLNELVTFADQGKLKDQVYAIYMSPLKALSNDIAVNLERPLAEITEIAARHGKKLDIRVGLRTGDTTPTEKQRMLRKPPHILVTTPESMAIMLASYKFVDLLNDVSWCIIDEIHSLAENKRGVHLSLSMERLQHISPYMARVGLSATVAPIEDVANYLVGTRECKIAQIDLIKKFDLQVMSPVEDLMNIKEGELQDKLYDLMDNLIQQHKTTLIFTNTRAGTERVVHHLKEKFPENYTENIGAHHGSLSKRHRLEIEDGLRAGKLKTVVCSTSLELGIDIGYIDLVLCLGSPKSVARFLQRVGRSGHSLHETVKGRMIVLDRDDLIECSVLLKNSLEKKIDRIHIPSNCLDVLAQQIDGMAVSDKWKLEDVWKLVTSSYCYKDLKRSEFMDVISYLAGHYVSLEERYIYAKIWYDEETQMIGKKGKMGRVIYMTNIGTIPDQTAVVVKIKDIAIGTIDEAFLEKLKRNDIFVLGGKTYQFRFARGMTAQVVSAEGKKPTVPSWYSEMLPLSYDLAKDIGRFRRLMEDHLKNSNNKKEVLEFINNFLYVDNKAAEAIYKYMKEQYLYAKMPNDKRILIENYHDENENKRYVVFHSLYGRRVNDVLSRAISYALSKLQKKDVEIGISDNGFYLASRDNMQALRGLNALKPEELRQVMDKAIDKTEVLKRRFRHCAGRALMILRQYKGVKKRVGRQQVSSMILLNAVKKISENFCILKEARREVLEDLMDIKNTIKILEEIKDGKIKVEQITTTIPTPFAFNLVLQGYTDIMKMEERMEFLKRMHNMVLAKIGKENKEMLAEAI